MPGIDRHDAGFGERDRLRRSVHGNLKSLALDLRFDGIVLRRPLDHFGRDSLAIADRFLDVGLRGQEHPFVDQRRAAFAEVVVDPVFALVQDNVRKHVVALLSARLPAGQYDPQRIFAVQEKFRLHLFNGVDARSQVLEVIPAAGTGIDGLDGRRLAVAIQVDGDVRQTQFQGNSVLIDVPLAVAVAVQVDEAGQTGGSLGLRAISENRNASIRRRVVVQGGRIRERHRSSEPRVEANLSFRGCAELHLAEQFKTVRADGGAEIGVRQGAAPQVGETANAAVRIDEPLQRKIRRQQRVVQRHVERCGVRTHNRCCADVLDQSVVPLHGQRQSDDSRRSGGAAVFHLQLDPEIGTDIDRFVRLRPRLAPRLRRADDEGHIQTGQQPAILQRFEAKTALAELGRRGIQTPRPGPLATID